MDRLPSFAVNLDEDPTDIFGAVCALLVCSALLKNCNNYLLDNKPSYCHVSIGKNTVTFELILLQTQQRSNWLDEILCFIILYVEVLASNFYSVFCTVYSGQELCPVIFPY